MKPGNRVLSIVAARRKCLDDLVPGLKGRAKLIATLRVALLNCVQHFSPFLFLC
jgi:hypothetical protein